MYGTTFVELLYVTVCMYSQCNTYIGLFCAEQSAVYDMYVCTLYWFVTIWSAYCSMHCTFYVALESSVQYVLYWNLVYVLYCCFAANIASSYCPAGPGASLPIP